MGIAFFNIKKRIRRHEVYTTYINTLPVYTLIENFNEIACIETIGLTNIYIYSCHTLLGSATVFFTRRTGFTVLIFTVFFRRFFIDKVNFGGVFIIIEQTIEFKREKPFEKILSREPRQFFSDSRQVTVYF